MFIGQHNHTLDDKNRLSLPAKFRKAIGSQVIVTHGLENCLFVYTLSEWKKFSEKLSLLSMGQKGARDFSRFLLAGAEEVSVDSTGRILLPEFLRKFAGIKQKVIIAGLHNRLEIWDEKIWKTYQLSLEKRAETVAEKLGEIGMI